MAYPDFKMEKHVIDRRIVQMQAEGMHFHNGVNVGVDLDAAALLEGFDAIVLLLISSLICLHSRGIFE